jgi:DNA-binding Lrp family transcriptional regulator
MDSGELDDLDRRIIYALQGGARRTSAGDVADEAGVSPSTVRKRLARLEDAGIVRGYHLDVDYERAGFQLHTLIVCTAPIPEREALARRAREVEGEVAVREVTTGHENVHVEVVGRDGDDPTRIGRELDALELTTEDEDSIPREYGVPDDGVRSSRLASRLCTTYASLAPSTVSATASQPTSWTRSPTTTTSACWAIAFADS